MSNKTRKRFLPVALVMAVAAIGVVAVAIALAGGPRDVQAHGEGLGCGDTPASRAVHDNLQPEAHGDCPEPANGNGNGNGNGDNGNGNGGGASNQGTADAPGAPMNVGVVVGDGKLTVTWGAPGSDGDSPITGYMVEYKPAAEADAEYMSSGMLPASAMKYVIMGLENETRYHVRVKVMNRVGSTSSSMNSGMPLAVPSMPRNLALAMSGHGEEPHCGVVGGPVIRGRLYESIGMGGHWKMDRMAPSAR